MMAVGQCGPLLGTNMFPEHESPFYRKGMWIGCAFCLVAAIASATSSTLLWLENRRRDRIYGPVKVVGQRADASSHLARETEIRYII